MIAICKREFSALFNTVIGWLFVGVMIALFGLYFFLYNMIYAVPTIAQTLSSITFIFMIAVPILTMRILSEERRNRTDQLIMTAPVSTAGIVLGKFLALAAVFTIPVILMAFTPPLLRLFGNATFADSYTALLGFYLYGLMAIAIGLFVSSLTESVVVSAVLSVIVLFIGFMMSSITGAVFPDGGVIAKVLGCYDFMSPLDDLMSGSLNFVSIVYYASICGLFLFLTVESIEKRRWNISIKKISGSVFSIGTIVVVIAAVVALNVIMAYLPSSKTSIDMTSKKYYSLTKKTKSFLKTYDEDVTIYGVGSKKEFKKSAREVAKSLDRYDEYSRHIKVKYINPETNPTFFTEYSEGELSTGTVVVAGEKRFKVIDASEMYESEVDYSTYQSQTTGYDGEGQITSALQYVATDDIPVVYILEGHKEMALGEDFNDVIEKSNYQQKSLNLLKEKAVPEDAMALIINGPMSDFSDDDVKKICDYIDAGGRVLCTVEFTKTPKLKGFEKLLAEYDVSLVPGMVADPDEDYYYMHPFYLLPEVSSEAASVSEVAGTAQVFSPYSSGIKHDKNKKLTFTELMTTSKKAFSKGGFDSEEAVEKVADPQSSVKREQSDPKGPFAVGLSVTNQKEGSLTVLGSAYFLSDAADTMVSMRNSTMFGGILNDMIPDEGVKDAIVIPVKKYEASTLTVTAKAARLYGILFIFVLPVMSLAAGVAVWIKRKRK